jgi:hypothetical protein
MKLRKFALAIALIATASHSAQGAIVLSEVLFNEVSSDTTGEWIEIYNTGPAAVDLSNYKIGDEEASAGTSLTEALYQFPAGAMINSGEVQVIAVSATRFNTVYGFMPTYETAATEAGVPDLTVYAAWDPDGGQINMSNTNDQAVIVGPADTVLDAASWGNNFAFNPSLGTTADGQSWMRKNVFVDTDTADDWELGPGTEVAAALRSTPGVANVPEPATLALALGAVALTAIRRRVR